MIFYFSGTGNSRWVAKEIAREQQEELHFISDIPDNGKYPFTLKPGEKVGFIFPIYSWGPPPVITEFIKKLQFKNYNNHYTFFVCTCGDDTGLSKEVFVKLLKQSGWQCNSGFSVIMPNNYILMKGFDTDPLPLQEKKKSEAAERVLQINELLKKRTDNDFRCKQGKFPFIKTKLIYPLFCRYQTSDKPFFATDACTGCKLCEKLCPAANIIVNGKPEWEHHCAMCLACIHHCPERAIQYGKQTQSKGRYFFSKH